MKNSQEINKAVEKTPRLFRNCVTVCLNEIEREEREHGEFASVDDFLRGYDPDYMEAPRIQTYVKYPADDDPFN